MAGAPGYEADDVIGTFTAHSPGPVEIVTGDRDLFQLVDDARPVRVIYTARGLAKLDIVDEAAVTARYHIPGRAYADYATLRGDPSDGLPGVAGVGDKTAAALVADVRLGRGDLAAIDKGHGGFPWGQGQAGGGPRLPGGRAGRSCGSPRTRRCRRWTAACRSARPTRACWRIWTTAGTSAPRCAARSRRCPGTEDSRHYDRARPGPSDHSTYRATRHVSSSVSVEPSVSSTAAIMPSGSVMPAAAAVSAARPSSRDRCLRSMRPSL